MKIKSFLLNVILLISSILLCFILTEIIWRILIFSSTDIFKSQKRAILYADPYSEDDYWKLQYNWVTKEEIAERKKLKPNKPNKPNKKHYTRYILRDKYKHINFKYVNDRRPVLLYGDSFATCYKQDGCFDHFLNNDESFSKNHYLLNYGVGGYGLDQIYLLFKNSIDNYNNPLVVMSFMTLDLDRSILSVRGGPKPYFTVENNMLKLHEKPTYPDIESFYSNNKPRIISYFYRRVLYSKALNKLIPDQFISYLKKENYYKKKKVKINSRILIEIIKELNARNIDYIFLIFHQGWVRGVGSLNNNVTDWRNPFIQHILDENNIPYIWSKDIILQNMKAENLSLSDYFIPGNGHPTIFQNELLAEKIKTFVLNSELLTTTNRK